VPRQIAEHNSLFYGVHYEAMAWEAYNASGSRYRHITRIREHLEVKRFEDSQWRCRIKHSSTAGPAKRPTSKRKGKAFSYRLINLKSRSGQDRWPHC
jgi:ribosomal protein L37AE/L43A